jgi:hypothetical protein
MKSHILTIIFGMVVGYTTAIHFSSPHTDTTRNGLQDEDQDEAFKEDIKLLKRAVVIKTNAAQSLECPKLPKAWVDPLAGRSPASEDSSNISEEIYPEVTEEQEEQEEQEEVLEKIPIQFYPLPIGL